MGKQGSKFSQPKVAIIAALKKYNGAVSYASRYLKCHHNTLLKHINKDPALIEILHDLRNGFAEELLDSAEGTLKHAVDRREEDIGSALKAAFFILNNKGKPRGYCGQVGSSSHGNEQDWRDFIASHPEVAREISSAYQSSRSSMENEQSVLHKGQGRKKDPLSDELGAEGTME